MEMGTHANGYPWREEIGWFFLFYCYCGIIDIYRGNSYLFLHSVKFLQWTILFFWFYKIKKLLFWGACVAQSVKCLVPVKCSTSAQAMISEFVSSSPVWGSVQTAPSLEPASDSVSPSLCVPPPLTLCLCLCLCLCLSLSKINIKQTNNLC